MGQSNNIWWMALIIAPFALLAKSLTLFGKAIMTLFKPSSRRVHKRAQNYLLEEDIKRSRVNLNKAKQGKIHAEIRLINAKKQAILNDSNTTDDTFTRAKLDKLRAEEELIRAKIKKMQASGGWAEQLHMPDGSRFENTGINQINLDDMDNAELNAKDYMGCAECNWIDATGKDVKCPKCGKPLRPINW